MRYQPSWHGSARHVSSETHMENARNTTLKKKDMGHVEKNEEHRRKIVNVEYQNVSYDVTNTLKRIDLIKELK